MTSAMITVALAGFTFGALVALRFDVRGVVLAVLGLIALSAGAFLTQLSSPLGTLSALLLAGVALQVGYGVTLLSRALLPARAATP